MSISHATTATFEDEVLKAEGLVLVDFWAEWCGPCKMITPILDEVDADDSISVKIVKVDIDENPEPPTQYNVRSIPTLALFKQGKLLGVKVGVLSKPSIVEWVSQS
ncbi:MAG: thioredoxin [Pseudomonadota bacterium]